jgi:hypothetical protein
MPICGLVLTVGGERAKSKGSRDGFRFERVFLFNTDGEKRKGDEREKGTDLFSEKRRKGDGSFFGSDAPREPPVS